MESYRMVCYAAVTNWVRIIRGEFMEMGFRLSFQNRAPEPVVVDADRQALGQAVGNLLDNAAKYSGESRDLSVWIERDGDRARIGVKDFGIGIPAEEQQKIFERFHRVSDSLVHDVRGTGLGLSIVQQIVAAHRGEVAVSSAPGKGSTFVVSLPLAGTVPAAVEGGST